MSCNCLVSLVKEYLGLILKKSFTISPKFLISFNSNLEEIFD